MTSTQTCLAPRLLVEKTSDRRTIGRQTHILKRSLPLLLTKWKGMSTKHCVGQMPVGLKVFDQTPRNLFLSIHFVFFLASVSTNWSSLFNVDSDAINSSSIGGEGGRGLLPKVLKKNLRSEVTKGSLLQNGVAFILRPLSREGTSTQITIVRSSKIVLRKPALFYQIWLKPACG